MQHQTPQHASTITSTSTSTSDATARTHSKPRSAARNSSIELLRLFSMLMIVAFHFVVMSPDTDWLNSQPLSFTKVIYQAVLMGGGWIGNFIFFTISTWFLLGKDQALKSNLRRIWLLERELLFWSLSLLIIYTVLNKTKLIALPIEKKYYVKSLFPMTTDLWWYPTSYALYILLLPFLIQGTKALGYKLHKQLAIIVLIIWGVAGFIPNITFDIDRQSVFVFIYWFILLSFYRWYLKPLTNRQCGMLVLSGVGINLAYYLLGEVISQLSTHGRGYSIHLFTHWSLTTMMIGFGLFLLCLYHPLHNKFVNVLARSAFGIYLISAHPLTERLINQNCSLRSLFMGAYPLATAFGCIVSIFFICLILDLLRQALFLMTVDRRPGFIFDSLYSSIAQNKGNHSKTDVDRI